MHVAKYVQTIAAAYSRRCPFNRCIMIEAYPLHWPEGWPRNNVQEHSRFKSTMAKSRDFLVAEINRLCSPYSKTYLDLHDPSGIIISTNVQLRNDGLPYASQRLPTDSGVAVYFTFNEKQMCFASDKYYYVWENLHAIAKTIEAIRAIERWSASDMMERAFTGFVALPPQNEHWRTVLKVSEDCTLENCSTNYKFLRSKYHPDKGGDRDDFVKLQKAWEECCEYFTKQSSQTA
tara:strand:+ start:12893 stop:13591 length:699 start_codon:yes stop_codon:yes gene_type:complete